MEQLVKILKKKLQTYDTKDLLGMISIQFMIFGNNGDEVAMQSNLFNKTNLMSPQKQYLYLAGLLMCTDDLSEGTKHNIESDFKNIENDIQNITSKYISGFMTFDEETKEKFPEKMKKSFVSAEAFASYFDTGILCYEEQILNLIKDLYAPFDAELEVLTSLSVDDYINFYHYIKSAFKESLEAPQKIKEEIDAFLNTLNPYTKDAHKEYKKVIDFSSSGIKDKYKAAVEGINTVSVTDIISCFGEEKGRTLINTFSLKRQERDFTYYNKINPFVCKPLCWVDDIHLFIVYPNLLLNAIFDYITNIIENPKNSFADKYTKVKADIVETLFLNHLKDIFGEKAKYHSQVCEERGTKEHDILIEFEDYIIIAEAKASKVREPFFNPEKAFTRIRDHFHSDSGIGGAYEQAIILKKVLEKNNDITLYENKTQPFTVNNILNKKIFPLVLTLNQFGSLAINTSQLIEKEDDQPYPWVCNLHDLENIIEVNKYLNKTPLDFIKYLNWRIDNHIHIFSNDELDILDYYYLNNKEVRKNDNDDIVIIPNGSNLIDKIYFEKHGIPYTLPGLKKQPIKRKKVGANEKCPCGSGLKYKRCCRGNGLYD